MKMVIVGDLHLGNNENDSSYINYQNQSLNWLLSVIKNYPRCVFLGDVFHNRNNVTHKTLNLYKSLFNQIDNAIMIVGNHDCHYKNTNELNMLSLLNNNPTNTIVVDDVYDIDDCCFVPWVNENNKEKLLTQIKSNKSKYCFGHFELSNFKLNQFTNSLNGQFQTSILKQFQLVVSGHYHIHSKKDNIVYLGTPYQMNFLDVNVTKHIMILDLETGDYELLDNPYQHYIELNVGDELPTIDCTNQKIKVNINNERTLETEQWLNSLEEKGNTIKIQDNFVLDLVDSDQMKSNIKSLNIIDVWNEYVGLQEPSQTLSLANQIFLEEYQCLKS